MGHVQVRKLQQITRGYIEIIRKAEKPTIWESLPLLTIPNFAMSGGFKLYPAIIPSNIPRYYQYAIHKHPEFSSSSIMCHNAK